MPAHLVLMWCQNQWTLLRNPAQFNELIEYFYNFWRSFDRLLFRCQRAWSGQRPYRTFNATIGQLAGLGAWHVPWHPEKCDRYHPRIYRQVAAAAEVSTIAVSKEIPFKSQEYMPLNRVPMMRQVLFTRRLFWHPLWIDALAVLSASRKIL